MRQYPVVIYGANGYTGKLIVALAASYQLTPCLAGRNESEIKKLAADYQLPFFILELSDSERLHSLLRNTQVLLHAAGPFRHTAKQVIEACVASKTHYIDITGEIEVFELVKTYDRAAKDAGIMIMPGCGFDVVPTDCLARYLKDKLPGASTLRLAFANVGGAVSHGTALTMIEGLGEGGAVRKQGKIIRMPLGQKGMWVDFGLKKLFVMTIPWGDVSTAYYTTGIPDIETYVAVPPKVFKLLKLQSLFNWLLKKKFVKHWLKGLVLKRPPGPSEDMRKNANSLVWGGVRNAQDVVVAARLVTPDGYTLTGHSSLIIARKIIHGDYKTGYQTPAFVYGSDLVLEVPGARREDI